MKFYYFNSSSRFYPYVTHLQSVNLLLNEYVYVCMCYTDLQVGTDISCAADLSRRWLALRSAHVSWPDRRSPHWPGLLSSHWPQGISNIRSIHISRLQTRLYRCIFMSCYLVRHCQVLYFQSTRYTCQNEAMTCQKWLMCFDGVEFSLYNY